MDRAQRAVFGYAGGGSGVLSEGEKEVDLLKERVFWGVIVPFWMVLCEKTCV